MADKRPDTIHLTLQGKGGIGKSMVSALLAQYLLKTGQPLTCYDADPVNATLSQHAALNATPMDLLRDGNIDPRRFDGLMENLLTGTGDAVIDCGASTFLPLTTYLAENAALDLLAQAGKRVLVHTVIVGGQALPDTLNGLNTLADTLPEATELVVWLNSYYGEIERDGKPFEAMKVYDKTRPRIKALIHLKKQPSATFERDVLDMMERKQTFAEALADDDTPIMVKQRLTILQRILFDQLGPALAV